MASRRLTPGEGTPPTLPPRPGTTPARPTTTTASAQPPAGESASPAAAAQAVRQAAQALRRAGGATGRESIATVSGQQSPVQTTVPGTQDEFTPGVYPGTREVLGIGGFIEFDVKTGKALRYLPGETGYVPSGRGDEGRGLYVTGQGKETLDKLSPEALATIQGRLKKAGYLNNYSPGYQTQRDVTAMERLMGDANVANLSWQEMLTVRAASGGASSYGRTAVRVSNPLDIEAAANRVAQELIGRGLDDATMQQFVRAFQQAQRSAGYGATQAPDIGSFTADRLAQMFPTETYARQFGTYMEALQQRYGM